MNYAIPIFDSVSFLAFAAALGFTLAIPTSSDSSISSVGKICMSLAFGVYVFAMFSNILEHVNLTAVLDPAEDYVEVLFPPLVLYALYATYVRQRERELVTSQRAAMRSQEMLLGIVDAAPAGILVLDAGGRITFANDTAKAILDLTESASGVFSHPGWVVQVGSAEPAPDFGALSSATARTEDVPVTVAWPTGWRVELGVRTEELGDAAGRHGGLVATFLPPQGLRPGRATE